MSSAAPELGREQERERELAESQLGAGDWERSQPSSRPSGALSALSDHTEQHNGKMLAHTSTIPLMRSLLFSFSFLAIFVSHSAFRETSLNLHLARWLPFFMHFAHLLSLCPISCDLQYPSQIHRRLLVLHPPHPFTFPSLVTRDGPCAVALHATALNQRKRRGKHGFRHHHPQTGSALINMHML